MKKKWIYIIIIVAVILVFPIKKECNDGGTVEYSAVLYKVINWNRIRIYEENKTGTEVHFFPHNFHSLEFYDNPRPDAIAVYNGDNFVVANIGTYQWSKEIDGTTLHVNACAVSAKEMEYKNTLKLWQGENIKIEGLISSPYSIVVYKFDGDKYDIIPNELKFDEITQTINLSEIEEGTHIIELYVQQGQNKACYSFKIDKEK